MFQGVFGYPLIMNEAMPGFTKIGKTTSSVEKRMKELDTAGGSRRLHGSLTISERLSFGTDARNNLLKMT